MKRLSAIVVLLASLVWAFTAAAQIGISMFPGPGASPAAATIVYTDSPTDSSAQTTYTLSAALGTAAANRNIVVGVTVAYLTTQTITSVTVGGVSAAALGTDITTANTRTNVYIASVPTGTSGNVVVTLSGGGLGAAAGVWATYGLNSTSPTDVQSSTANPGTVNLNISAGGVAVGFASNANSVNTYTWTNLNEDFDKAYNASNSTSGASSAFATAQSGLAITATRSGSPAQRALIAVSLR